MEFNLKSNGHKSREITTFMSVTIPRVEKFTCLVVQSRAEQRGNLITPRSKTELTQKPYPGYTVVTISWLNL